MFAGRGEDMQQTALIEGIHQRFQGILGHVRTKYPERAWMYEPAAKYFELLRDDLAQGKPIAWYFFLVTPEIFRAMDVATCSPEYVGSVVSSFPEGIKRYVDVAEEKVPDYMCTVNKFTIGALLAGDMPYPDMMIHAIGHPCDSASAIHPMLANYLKVPDFGLDTPYWDTPRSYKYFAEELGRAVAFMEQQTGRKMDVARLREVVENSNRAQEYVLKLAELRKRVPCPLNGRASAMTGGAIMALAGTPFLVDWVARQYELARARAERGEAAVANERIRVVWIWLPTFFDLGILDWMEQKYGAVCVMDLINHYSNKPIEDLSTKEKMLEGLAHKTLDYPMGRHGRGPVDLYLRECLTLCQEYKADAAVFAGHVGCKYAWATAKVVKDAIRAELGIPTLTFEFDAFDPRTASLDTIKERLAQFIEAIL
ncbi:MAG: 2-hydroxyacyl-CoA dehydratase family protein [Chloroflexota bacterium]